MSSSTTEANKASSDAYVFLPLTRPTYMPILTTPDGTASAYLPGAQLTSTSEVHGYDDVPPERQGVDFGGIDYFKIISNTTNIYEKCTLVVQLDNLTAGAGGALPRYPDDVIAHAIDHVDFEYGKKLESIYGDELHWKFLTEYNGDDMERHDQLRGCNLPVGRRIANATQQMWYYLDIPFFWTKRKSDAWHQYALQKLTRIIIYWRTPNYILQQEVANTMPTPAHGGTYIVNHFLRFKICAPTEATKQEFVRRVTAQGQGGWLYLIGQDEWLTQTLPVGTTTNVYLLNTFTKYGYNLRFVIRAVTSLQPNYLDNDRWNLIPIATARLQISGKDYLPTTDDYVLRYDFQEQYFEGNPEWSVYNIPFCENPQEDQAALGGIEFSLTSNPQLTITTTAAAPATCQIDFYLNVHNYVRLNINSSGSDASLAQPL